MNLFQEITQEYIDILDYKFGYQIDYLVSLTEPFYSETGGPGYVKASSVHINECNRFLELVKEKHPLQFSLNGNRCENIWICKPGALSRGRGIFVTKDFNEILNIIKPKEAKKKTDNWVVQK